jgi:chemotaxis protein methyltransferase CheR
VKSRKTILQRDFHKTKTAEKTKISVSRRKEKIQLIAKDMPPKGLYEEALDSYISGNYLRAEEKLMDLVNTDHHNSKACILLARVHANQGNLDTALDWCEKALNENKLDPDSHYLRSLILEEQGKDAQALESLKRTLYLDPSFVLAHFSLGNLALKQGRRGDGERHFANTLDILSRLKPDEVIHESEGITAGRLVEIISSVSSQHSEGAEPLRGNIARVANKLQRSRSLGLH